MKFLPGDHRLFETAGWSGPNGSKSCGPPGRVHFLADDASESTRARGAALRDRLAEILGPLHHEQAMKIFVVEGMSCQQLAAELGDIHPGNACRWKQRFLACLRKAILAAAWQPAPWQDGHRRWGADLIARLKTVLIAEVVHAEIAAGKESAIVDPTTAETAPAVDAWCVALAGTERTYPQPPTRAEIAAYVQDHADVLDNAGHHQGARHDGSGVWRLEVTVLIRNFAQAMTFAVIQGRRSISNLKTRTLVPVATPTRTPA